MPPAAEELLPGVALVSLAPVPDPIVPLPTVPVPVLPPVPAPDVPPVLVPLAASVFVVLLVAPDIAPGAVVVELDVVLLGEVELVAPVAGVRFSSLRPHAVTPNANETAATISKAFIDTSCNGMNGARA